MERLHALKVLLSNFFCRGKIVFLGAINAKKKQQTSLFYLQKRLDT